MEKIDIIRKAILDNIDNKDKSAYTEAIVIIKALEDNKLQIVNKNDALLDVSFTLRDKLAAKAMLAEIYSLNNMTLENIERYRKYLLDRWGSMTITEAIAKESYDSADALLKARSNEN